MLGGHCVKEARRIGGDSASRQLDDVFGHLALLTGCVTRPTLEEARNRHAASTALSLGAVLVQMGAISNDEQSAIEQLCQRHVGGTPPRSIGAQPSDVETIAHVRAIDDPSEPAAGETAAAGGTTMIGDYELLGEIARGGMGVVYKARQASLNRTVALKMIRASEISKPDQVRRFYSEAESAARLEHPGIVQVFQAGLHNGEHFFTMAFVEGKNLNDLVKQSGPLAPRRAARLMQLVAEAVHYAHEKGVVHRDLKPQNILLDEQQQPKVTDFGLAKQVNAPSELTVSGEIIGTPSYMPPEQAAGSIKEIGPAADVYGLGATLYFLLVGRAPFQAASILETIRQVLEVEPAAPRRLNPAIPRDLETICLKCLRKQASSRYVSVAALADDLGRWLEGRPILARRVTVPERAWMWCRRRPFVVAACAFAAVVVIASALIVDRRQKGEHAQGLVNRLKSAQIAQLPGIIDELGGYRAWADPMLRAAHGEAGDDSAEKLNLCLALLPVDKSMSNEAREWLLRAEPDQFPILRNALADREKNFVDELWTIARDSRAGAPRRFRAACALATYASRDERWSEVCDWVANELTNVNAVHLRDWATALRPARKHLLVPLSEIYRDRSLDDAQLALCADVLVDFANDQVELLVDLLHDGSPRQFAVVFPALARHERRTVDLLTRKLTTPIPPPWSDAPLDEKWAPMEPALVESFSTRGGLVAERFAVCANLPLAEFQNLADRLRASGYRPSRLRPFHDGSNLVAAAIWTRDGLDFRTTSGATTAELMAHDEALRKEHFLPIDVAAYVDPADRANPRFAAVWIPSPSDAEDARIVVGQPKFATGGKSELGDAGYQYAGMQQFVIGDAQPGHCFIRRKAATETEASTWQSVTAFQAEALSGKQLVDVCVSASLPLKTSHEVYAGMLATAEQTLLANPQDLASLTNRAVAHCGLQRDAQAIEELTALLPGDTTVYPFRAVCHARLGNREAALADAAEHARITATGDPSHVAYVNTIVEAWLGDASCVDRLLAELAKHEGDPQWFYNAACALGVASRAFAERNSELAARCRNQASELLTRAVNTGYANPESIAHDLDLEGVRDSDAFRRLLAAWRFDLSFAALWSSEANFETIPLLSDNIEAFKAKRRELAAAGYRPLSISACARAAEADSGACIASVWRRPTTSEVARDQQEQGEAQLAAGLLRFGAIEVVRPLLKYGPDPGPRSHLIEALAPLHCDPKQMTEWFLAEADVDVRRALLLALGEYTPRQFPEPDRALVLEPLFAILEEHPDPGLRACAEWLLRKWSHGDRVDSVVAKLGRNQTERAAHDTPQRERWHVNAQAQTMVVFDAGEFLMGSAPSEPGRGATETQHSRRIMHRFAISSREVTHAQFARFQQSHPESFVPGIEKTMTTDDSPQVAVTWYEAAAYCNWLSEQDKIPPEQWCYLPNNQAKYAAGMRAKENAAELIGYRLPTEAEWEFACRAGSSSSRYYGSSTGMLRQYAWHGENSANQVWPTGTRKPNDAGLFDMMGNASEWCHNAFSTYPVPPTGAVNDVFSASAVDDSQTRILRGASFGMSAVDMRSALRYTLAPNYRGIDIGFRVARTMK